MIKILELFGGIGSPRKALINLGVDHKCIDYIEIDEKAVRTYNALFDNNYSPQSVIDYNLRPDFLVHGSPCQDFSRAGKRLGGNDEDKTRSSLVFETLKIIENLGKWKPKFVIWENVKGVLDKASLEHKTKDGKLNGTLYKQAGNSIVVQVLEAIFKELLKLNDSNFI